METDVAIASEAHRISAYAKLEFEHFSFFIQTLTLVVGRKAKRDDNVDVHLGMSKGISRQHARIYYQFSAMTWEIQVLGKNGAFVNDRYIEAGGSCALRTTDHLQIADTLFTFLLPEGSVPPVDPGNHVDIPDHDDALSASPGTIAPGQILRAEKLKVITQVSAPTPLAPHHFMRRSQAPIMIDVKGGSPPSVRLSQLEMTPGDTRQEYSEGDSEVDSSFATVAGELPKRSKIPKAARKKSKKNGTAKEELSTQTTVEESELKPSSGISATSCNDNDADNSQCSENGTKADHESKLSEEETAAQQAAQLLHQERLTRQAQEEEEGLILPPPETDPAVIAAFVKPPASYATMIYNAITSHEKKKMTLAQIYSWICISHPYYRYILNGWQNSIRHNLSLNKAFMKVLRSDDEPGKGSFWAVDPNSEMLFEGGIYKKKPPRPPPLAPQTKGSPVVMKSGKLALNPSFFTGSTEGKADDIFKALQEILRKQLGPAYTTDHAVQLVRVLALALAAQLKTATLDAASVRQLLQQHAQANARTIRASTGVSASPTLPPAATALAAGPKSITTGLIGQVRPLPSPIHVGTHGIGGRVVISSTENGSQPQPLVQSAKYTTVNPAELATTPRPSYLSRPIKTSSPIPASKEDLFLSTSPNIVEAETVLPPESKAPMSIGSKQNIDSLCTSMPQIPTSNSIPPTSQVKRRAEIPETAQNHGQAKFIKCEENV